MTVSINTAEVDRKSQSALERVTITASGSNKNKKKKNVLNAFRSYTYNFTLAAVKAAQVSDPTSYRDKPLDLVVLKSGGKGTAAIKASATAGTTSRLNPELTRDDNGNSNVVYDKGEGEQLVNEFNESSPGRFDMYIDNVEVDTIMTPSANANFTTVTGLSFDVFEPLSISGFIEALHVAAVSAGYPSYMGASFLMKLEFSGYIDSEELPTPEVLGRNATRYILFTFRTIDLDINENGTRYKCTGVPWNEMALGDTVNTLVGPIKAYGNTVEEVLKSLMEGKSKQKAESDKDSKLPQNATKSDSYEIKFPTKVNGEWDYNTVNDIGKCLIRDLTEATMCRWDDPGTTTRPNNYGGDNKPTPQENAKDPERIKYEPNSNAVQFPSGLNLHEAISSVVRDSKYGRDLLAHISSKIDDQGMLDYFLIKTKVENTGGTDQTSNKLYQKFTYIVVPYKVHISQIPNYMNLRIDPKKLTPLTNREYEYLYTGKNVDIINFRLNFNSLFYQAVPRSMGNNQSPSARDGIGPNQDSNVTLKPLASAADKTNPGGVAETAVTAKMTEVLASGANAGSPLYSPYAILAKNMHNALLDTAGGAGLKGDLEIIGDPFYLVTSNGNYDPTTTSPGVTSDEEADYQASQVLIKINFRNPIDINPLDKGGRMDFQQKKVSFSGVFRVNKVKSTFRDGTFKQNLEVGRIFGQTLEDNVKADDPAEILISRPNPLNVVTPDTSKALAYGQRASEQSLLGQLLKIGTTIAGAQNILAGVVGQAQNALVGVLGAPTAAATLVANRITNTINGITSPISDAANALGISPAQLANMSLSDMLAAKVAASILPNDVNLADFQALGALFIAAKSDNYPPSPNYATAPAAGATIGDTPASVQSSISETGVTSATKKATSAGAEVTSVLNYTEFFRPSTTSVNVNSTPSVTDKYSTAPTSPLAKLNISDTTYDN
jgi:hypothetical protein